MSEASSSNDVLPDVIWSSRPRLAETAVHRVVDGQVVLWPEDATIGSIDPVASVVVPWLDGSATVQELADDFAAAAEVEADEGRAFIGQLVRMLTLAGAVEDVDELHDALLAEAEAEDAEEEERMVLPEPEAPAVDLGERRAMPGAVERIGPVDSGDGPDLSRPLDYLSMSPEELDAITTSIEVEEHEEGRRSTTRYLVGGARIVSTQMTIGMGNAAGRAQFDALVDGRSPAELAPGDSCLGSKLRNGDDLPILDVDLSGDTASIRCSEGPVLDALASRFSSTGAGEPAGPVEVFVVAPYEGQGPMRVFDGWGRRRGRPRSPEDVVDVVVDVLADDILSRRDRIHAVADVVVHRDDVVLLPFGTLSHPRLIQALARCGITARSCRPVIVEDGTVELDDRVLGGSTPPRYRVRAILTGVDDGSDRRSPVVRLIEQLLAVGARGQMNERAAALDAAIALTTSVPQVPVTAGDLDDLVATVATLLGAPVPLSL